MTASIPRKGKMGSGQTQDGLGGLLALEADLLLLVFSKGLLTEVLIPGVIHDLDKSSTLRLKSRSISFIFSAHKGDPIRGGGGPGSSVLFQKVVCFLQEMPADPDGDDGKRGLSKGDEGIVKDRIVEVKWILHEIKGHRLRHKLLFHGDGMAGCRL